MSLEPLVLVVDDDEDTRRAVRQLLEEEGYVVEEATNGRLALERLGRLPSPALVLLDLMMPVMDGRTLLKEIEAHPEFLGVPIVVMTASAVDEASSTVKVPMLRKPVDVDALLRIVEQYSPRFWDEDEPGTEETLIVCESEADRATAKHFCAGCGQVAQTRCSGCGTALCQTCFARGSGGVCADCCREHRGV